MVQCNICFIGIGIGEQVGKVTIDMRLNDLLFYIPDRHYCPEAGSGRGSGSGSGSGVSGSGSTVL